MPPNIFFLLSTLIQISILLVFMREYYIKRVKLNLILVVAFILTLTSQILFTFINDFEEIAIELVLIPALSSLTFGLFLFFLYFDMLENSKPSLKEILVYMFNLGYLHGLFLLFAAFIISDSPVRRPTVSIELHQVLLSNPLFAALILTFILMLISGVMNYAIIIPLRTIQKILNIKTELVKHEQSREFNLLLTGFILYFASSIIIAITILTPASGSIFPYLIYYALQIVGELTILYVFITGKAFLFSTHRLDNLLLVNKAGLVLFNYEFAGSKTKVNELLIGGILSALSSGLKEIVDSQETVEDIKLGDIHLTFRSLTDKYYFILISARSSHLINQTLDNFTIDVKKQFKDKFNSLDAIHQSNSAEWKDIAKLVDKYFIVKGIDFPVHDDRKEPTTQLIKT